MYLFSKKNNEDFINFVKKLNGIFAFAIWDKNFSELILSRDRFGVKPLYYFYNKEVFVFSSEIKAINNFIKKISKFENQNYSKIDSGAFFNYLTFLWNPGESTPLENVKKLDPGVLAIINSENLLIKKIWYQFPIFNKKPALKKKFFIPKNKKNEKYFISKTEKLLREAVHRQMISDVPLGAFLSGGLDSSSIVHFAKEINPKINCFSINVTFGKNDDYFSKDLIYSKRVASHLKVPLQIVDIEGRNLSNDLNFMIKQLDEPLADFSALNVYYIAKAAKENGIKVLLSGTGGDDIFGGYRRHKSLKFEKYWLWLPKQLKVYMASYTKNFSDKVALKRRIKKMFSGAYLNENERICNYFYWYSRKDLIKLFSDEFKANLNSNLNNFFDDFLKSMPKNSSKLEKMLTLDQRFFLSDHNLIYTDKMSMASSVEVRVPFLDNKLVSFSSQIPDDLKIKGFETKWILKKALEKYLPRDIIYRPKVGFGAPIKRMLENNLNEIQNEVLSSRSLTKRGIFDPLEVQKLILKNKSMKFDTSYTIFSLICIELWCRSFIDN